jgi:NADH-quinone oxidoreductase subunit M
MRLLLFPWLDLAIVAALVGSLCLSRVREPAAAARWGIAFTGLALGCSILAWLGFYLGETSNAGSPWSMQPQLFGRQIFLLDELSAPLVSAVALLHFLTAVATTRSRMRQFSFSWSLASEAIRLAMFSCRASWLLVALLAVCTVPPYLELRNRQRPTRVYVLHMLLFVGLMTLGWAAAPAQVGQTTPSAWATVPLLLAILVRCGTVPAHCWVTDWFEHASSGNALLFVIPLPGVYAAVRLVLPIAPGWVLQSIGIASLVTAVYAAGMALIQRETRRFFAYLFLSHASLVLVGLELSTALSLTASLCLWFSVILSVGGFGLTLRALESRVGRTSLSDYHGLYEHTPTLAVCFLLTGLASVGFPGTLGFISTELLVDSAVEVNPFVGIAVVTAAALNGIAVLRAFFRIFTGARRVATVSLRVGPRERFAVLTLTALILGGGLYPQPGVSSRYEAAEEILKERRQPQPALVGRPAVRSRWLAPAVPSHPDLLQ